MHGLADKAGHKWGAGSGRLLSPDSARALDKTMQRDPARLSIINNTHVKCLKVSSRSTRSPACLVNLLKCHLPYTSNFQFLQTCSTCHIFK